MVACELFCLHKATFVKPFFLFFIAVTMAEIMFSAGYYYLTWQIDLTLFLSALVYLTLIISAYVACRNELYIEKRQALLDSLCQSNVQ